MVKFLKTNLFNVKNPKCNVGDDAGIDTFCPSYSEEFKKIFEEENPGKTLVKDEKGCYVLVEPQEDVLINSGLYTLLEKGTALIAFNKSGVARKQHLCKMAEVDDYSYEGLLHIHVVNTGKELTKIYCDEKVVQWIQVKIAEGFEVFEERDISKDEFFKNHTKSRGDGGFGSTTLK